MFLSRLSFKRNQKPSLNRLRYRSSVTYDANEQPIEPLPISQMPGPSNVINGVLAVKKIFEKEERSDEIDKLVEEYGPIFKIPLPFMDKPIVITTNHEDFKNIIQNEGEYPRGMASSLWPSKLLEEKYPGSIAEIQLEGEKWKIARLKLQEEMFSPVKAGQYYKYIARSAERISKEIPYYQDDINQFFLYSFFDLFFEFFAGQNSGLIDGTADDEIRLIADSTVKYLGTIIELARHQPYKMKTSLKVRRQYKIFEDSHHIVQNNLYKWVIKKFEEGKVDPDSYLGKLIHVHGHDYKEISKFSAPLLNAASDTSANTMQWYLYHVTVNKDVQDKMRKEAFSVLKGRSINNMQEANKLRYINCALKESQRITPGVVMLAREVPKDLVQSGYMIPRGTSVVNLTNTITARDPKIYENPLTFNPDRWTSEKRKERRSEGKSAPHDSAHSFTQFSLGARMCLGARIAAAEQITLMSRLLQDYEITLQPDSPIPDIHRLPTAEIWKPKPTPKFQFTPLDKESYAK